MTPGDIKNLIDCICDPQTPAHQTSAMLMAIYLKGMTMEETTLLTEAMVNSGDRINLSSVSGTTLDKHSTGGVGDKTTLIIVPLLASLGIPILKLSGKGLGHTGGTLDKLTAFTGIELDLHISALVDQVKHIGCAIAGQSKQLVPADKIMYALRDQTDTISSLPLIASSIMSKKIAAGANQLLLDVKVGSGANVESLKDNRKLASMMVEIGSNLGISTQAVLTDMTAPLGHAVGNILEVQEAMQILRGQGPIELRNLCLELSCIALEMCGRNHLAKNRSSLIEYLHNGKALDKLREMIEAQKGSTSLFADIAHSAPSKYTHTVYSDQDGYIQNISAKEIGIASLISGAGRQTHNQAIDLTAGIYLHKVVGDSVRKKEPLCTIYSSNKNKLAESADKLKFAIEIGQRPPDRINPIIERIG